MQKSEDKRLTVTEVAEELGVSEKTVRGLIRRQHLPLPAYKISKRKTYVLRGDLDAFVDSCRTAPVRAERRR